jgi:cell volume regulation protein A
VNLGDTTTTVALLGALLILAGVAASKVSARFGIPALLLFLALGMFAGSDGPGGLAFDNPQAAQTLGILGLTLILFSGGLDTAWDDARRVVVRSAALATVGVLLTALALGYLTHRVLDVPLTTAMLFGAIVSSTDAAAVLAVLRSKSISLRGMLRPLLEVESGGNDPMALFLTTAAIGLAVGNPPGVGETVLRFLWQFALGGAFGYVAGRAYPWIMSHADLEYEGLYPVLSLGLVLAIYALCALTGANSLLAAYTAGIVAARDDFFHRRSMARFHAGVAWLMQITMFTVLGLLVFPSRLPAVVGVGLGAAALLMLVARPLAVMITTLPFRPTWRERALLSWVGLRGAAPIVLATFPRLAGLPEGDLIFHLVFFVVLVSTALQGTTVPYVAKWLGVDAPLEDRPPYPLEYNPVAGMGGTLTELEVGERSPAVGRSIMALRLPADLLVVLVARGEQFIIPKGATVIEPGDRLLVLGENSSLDATRRLLEATSANGQAAA